MKSVITHSAFVLTLLAAGSAMAADPYAGGSIVFLDADATDVRGADASLTGVTGRLGAMANDNIGGEDPNQILWDFLSSYTLDNPEE